MNNFKKQIKKFLEGLLRDNSISDNIKVEITNLLESYKQETVYNALRAISAYKFARSEDMYDLFKNCHYDYDEEKYLKHNMSELYDYFEEIKQSAKEELANEAKNDNVEEEVDE